MDGLWVEGCLVLKEDKTEGNRWHDHIGIVLSCERNSLLVAEDNADDKNVSGIITRKRNNTISCYVRIPESYKYDGWKTDFKSGEVKIVNYMEE